MIKKFRFSLALLIMVLIAPVVFFAGCGKNPNSGLIDGLQSGEFTAHFNRGLVFFQDSENQAVKILSKRSELIDWFNTIQQTNYSIESDVFPEYCDVFFESHQLVFISFLGSILDYEVQRISYKNNTLTIEFITTTRPNDVLIDLGVTHTAIVEITRISHDLNVAFSHRRR